MFVTPARCAQVRFCGPINDIGQGMIVKSGNPAAITSYDYMVKKPLRLAIMAGAAQAGPTADSGKRDASHGRSLGAQSPARRKRPIQSA